MCTVLVTTWLIVWNGREGLSWPLTPAGTTVVLVDYAAGFANLLGTHDLPAHLNAVTGPAKTAKWYGSGLVVTNGQLIKPSGPLHPELLDVIGDQPVIERATDFNSFLDEPFAEAVRATGRQNLVIGGVATDGCVLQTVLGGLREGYNVHVVVDASASLSVEARRTSVQRMIPAGAAPLTWFSPAAEFQLDPKFHDAPAPGAADAGKCAGHGHGRPRLHERPGAGQEDGLGLNLSAAAPCSAGRIRSFAHE